jgi:hypothetical protein
MQKKPANAQLIAKTQVPNATNSTVKPQRSRNITRLLTAIQSGTTKKKDTNISTNLHFCDQ